MVLVTNVVLCNKFTKNFLIHKKCLNFSIIANVINLEYEGEWTMTVPSERLCVKEKQLFHVFINFPNKSYYKFNVIKFKKNVYFPPGLFNKWQE